MTSFENLMLKMHNYKAILIEINYWAWRQDNYVANILFSSDIVQTEIFNGTLFNISGEVTICSNRFYFYLFIRFTYIT